MAKDTEKLIRQLSLISYLMAQGRPTSALEIKREVEGYSDMNDDAFARRFYADRAELDALGITLQVEKPGESLQGYESELYSLPPENYYLPEIRFADDELAALQTALHLLDGEFAYAEPLRLALQQVSWGRPSPLTAPEQSSVEVRMTAKADGAEVSQRLSKIETAISRRKTIEFTYYTIERDSEEKRKVDPYHLVYRGGQFYLIGHSHERDADPGLPPLADPGQGLLRLEGRARLLAAGGLRAPGLRPPRRVAARRDQGRGEDLPRGPDRLAGRARLRRLRRSSATPAAATARPARAGSSRPSTPRAARWSPGCCTGARTRPCSIRPSSPRRWPSAWSCSASATAPTSSPPNSVRTVPPAPRAARSNGRSESSIRPERFARLVTLAGMLIESAKGEARLPVADVKERLHVSDEELRDDIDLLNVVNFGGGTYVLYAELQGDEIEVDAEPYGDNFARPARLLPLEAKALVAAIDLFGDHLPQSGLASARKKIVAALGHDPSEEGLEIAAVGRRRLRCRPQGEQGDRGSAGSRHPLLQGERGRVHQARDRALPARQRPGGLVRRLLRPPPRGRPPLPARPDQGGRGLARRAFEPRPEVEEIAAIEGGWLSGENVPAADVARVWVSPERARWAREEHTVVEELADDAVVIEVPYGSTDWLLREILKGAGELVVLEPESAREAIARRARGRRRRDAARPPSGRGRLG